MNLMALMFLSSYYHSLVSRKSNSFSYIVSGVKEEKMKLIRFFSRSTLLPSVFSLTLPLSFFEHIISCIYSDKTFLTKYIIESA